MTEPTGLFDRRYVPSLSVVLRGRKRSIVGDDDQVWGRERFIITPVDLPVVAGVVDTAGSDGFVSAVWRLDPTVVGEVVASMSAPTAPPRSEVPRLGTWTAPLADAFARLLALLDAPEDVPVLFPLVSREIVLRLLQTEQAPRITAALDGSGTSVVAAATALLTGRMAEPWSMDRLTRELRVSESTLFARFKEATGMTPAQYLKRTRLGEARRRMVVHGDRRTCGHGRRLPQCIPLFAGLPGGVRASAGGGRRRGTGATRVGDGGVAVETATSGLEARGGLVPCLPAVRGCVCSRT